MSNPENAAAQGFETNNSETADNNQEQDFSSKVNSVVKQLTQDDKGIWQMPDGLEVDESVAYAAKLEKRRRDTESALGKTRQQLKAEETIRKTLEQRVAERVDIDMTAEDKEQLESLKYDDPDAWRKKMNQLEQKATTTLREELDGLSSEASQQAEMERRAQVLEQFNAEHSDVQIDDDALANDIPPRIVKKLESGQVTFEEFLQESYKFLSTPKKIKDDKLEAQPNLGSAGGGSNPAADAIAQDAANSYQNEVF